jgi:hypothetical protein
MNFSQNNFYPLLSLLNVKEEMTTCTVANRQPNSGKLPTTVVSEYFSNVKQYKINFL